MLGLTCDMLNNTQASFCHSLSHCSSPGGERGCATSMTSVHSLSLH